MKIKHPIAVGTNVKYLSPRCPCSGKKYEVTKGIVDHTIIKGQKIIYNIRGDRHQIPTAAIVAIIGK